MAMDVDNPQGELVRDPYNAKQCYKAWDRTIKGISETNARHIIRYLEDMRRGLNVSVKAVRGRRGYKRLITQRNRLRRISSLLAEHQGIENIAPTSSTEWRQLETAIMALFERMEDGDIPKLDGGRYRSVGDHIKGFKAFWHWHMTAMKREHGRALPDITEQLVVKNRHKPSFVYFGEPGSVEVEDGFRKLYDHANYKYRAMLAFMFDSGVRSPTELVNVKRKDITPIKGTPYFHLNIRAETSKTFGRRMKLMFCHDQLRTHIEEENFGAEDFLFPICPRVVNQYLKRLGQRALNKSGLTMYDFRHNSVCYFLPRYNNQNALMYRFGWKDASMIHYYSEFLGMRDTLNADDFLVDVTKTQVERELDTERKQRVQLQEELAEMRTQLTRINSVMNTLTKDEAVVELLARKAYQHKEELLGHIVD